MPHNGAKSDCVPNTGLLQPEFAFSLYVTLAMRLITQINGRLQSLSIPPLSRMLMHAGQKLVDDGDKTIMVRFLLVLEFDCTIYIAGKDSAVSKCLVAFANAQCLNRRLEWRLKLFCTWSQKTMQFVTILIDLFSRAYATLDGGQFFLVYFLFCLFIV